MDFGNRLHFAKEAKQWDEEEKQEEEEEEIDSGKVLKEFGPLNKT